MCHYGKKTFFNVRKKVPIATKPRGGGLKALMAGPLRKNWSLTERLLFQNSGMQSGGNILMEMSSWTALKLHIAMQTAF